MFLTVPACAQLAPRSIPATLLAHFNHAATAFAFFFLQSQYNTISSLVTGRDRPLQQHMASIFLNTDFTIEAGKTTKKGQLENQVSSVAANQLLIL